MRRIFAVALIFFISCSKGNLRFTDGETDLSSEVGSGLLDGTADKLRLGNRFFVATVLNDIFGPGATAVTDAMILPSPGYFGGPCDKNLGDCNEAGESQMAMIPVSTSPRAALLVRSCDMIVSVDANVTYAVGQVRTVGATLPPPTDSDLLALFDLFHPGRPPTAEVIDGLSAIRTASTSPIEAWRFVLLALCESPAWQVP